MAKQKEVQILVYADWVGLGGPQLLGVLSTQRLRGKELFAFEYDNAWLKSQNVQLLDPDLQLYGGKQYLNDSGKTNFGLFLDSSPDRFGRVLMRRREAALARSEERTEQPLFVTDYLLGVYDGHRMGALRFKINDDGPFLDDRVDMATPPWSSIRTLEQASLKLEEENVVDDPEYLRWLNMLMAPGSSLGGARPKASVLDPDGQLWIAKFPSKNDKDDVGAWEKVTHVLAVQAGIDIADAKAQVFSNKSHTFLTKRFDRTDNGGRIHFASAMTLLGYTDGADHSEGASYLELADFITNQGAQPTSDLKQLWRRIVFHICVSNTDDHLRNHGFLLTPKGWKLSPAYDINPNETGTGLTLNINEHENALDINLAMEASPYFRLSEKEALSIVTEVKSATANWHLAAEKLGSAKAQRMLKVRAFEHGLT
ncbi:MAG: HipA domain-containing protein [Salibacteraceae bacterium]